ncbi:hypothetical protein SUGI_0433400 [Cryptomeria japonica]|nr:hypothetical protein SUGI_0433400 [Cryptomeria japonica]
MGFNLGPNSYTYLCWKVTLTFKAHWNWLVWWMQSNDIASNNIDFQPNFNKVSIDVNHMTEVKDALQLLVTQGIGESLMASDWISNLPLAHFGH